MRHPHLPLEWHLRGDAVRTRPAADELYDGVGDGRGSTERDEPGRRRPLPAPAAGDREDRARRQRQPRVVRGFRQPSHRAVEPRRRRRRDRLVHRVVEAIELGEQRIARRGVHASPGPAEVADEHRDDRHQVDLPEQCLGDGQRMAEVASRRQVPVSDRGQRGEAVVEATRHARLAALDEHLVTEPTIVP